MCENGSIVENELLCSLNVEPVLDPCALDLENHLRPDLDVLKLYGMLEPLPVEGDLRCVRQIGPEHLDSRRCNILHRLLALWWQLDASYAGPYDELIILVLADHKFVSL